MLGIRGATMTQDDVMEIEGESVAASMETGDTSRAGIGMKADVSGGYSEAGQVPQALIRRKVPASCAQRFKL